jgi:anaerobic nitric oxide reductase transcription regulator
MRGALRASARARGQTVLVDAGDLGLGPKPAPAITRPPHGDPRRLREAVDEFTKHMIATTVTDCQGNWAEAARRLGLQRGNLHRLAHRLRMHEHP